MPAFDLHQHLWPEPLIRALEHRTERPRLRGRRLELAVEGSFDVDLGVHELDARLSLLDRHGLDVALVSLAPTMETDGCEDLVDAYHQGIAEVTAASGGRIVALAEGTLTSGFAGICVSASALCSGIDDMFSSLQRLGGLLFVHPGPPAPPPAGAPSWWAAAADYTTQMQAAYMTWLWRDANRFPSVPILFAILAGGGPFQLERLRSRGVEVRTILHPNAYFDTSSYGRRALELCFSTYGVTQLVFGSDAPVIEPDQTLEAVNAFGEAVTDIVLRRTPERLLGMSTMSP